MIPHLSLSLLQEIFLGKSLGIKEWEVTDAFELHEMQDFENIRPLEFKVTMNSGEVVLLTPSELSERIAEVMKEVQQFQFLVSFSHALIRSFQQQERENISEEVSQVFSHGRPVVRPIIENDTSLHYEVGYYSEKHSADSFISVRNGSYADVVGYLQMEY